MPICWRCEAPLAAGAEFCSNCGHSQLDRDSSPIFVVDARTQLFNAVFTRAVLDQESRRAIRYKRPFSVLVVELDHAEDLGRELVLGQFDRLLNELGQVLAETVREIDTLGFIEADGAALYAILLPETDAHGALLAGDKVRRAVASNEFRKAGQWRRLTVSCGASTLNLEQMGDQDLLDEAWQALRSGRASGTGPNHTFTRAHA